MGNSAFSLRHKPQVERMDRGSKRNTSIDDLLQYILYDNIAAARKFMKNYSPEFRQIILKQHDKFSFEPLIIYTFNNGSLEMLKFVVDECKVNLNEPIRFSYTLFRCYLGGKIPRDGNICLLSPLQYVICMYSCTLDKIKFLVDRGADVNAATTNGVTCLMLAAARDFVTSEFLIETGANLSAVNEVGQTALHIAVAFNQISIAKFLVEKGLDPFYHDYKGDYPISIAYSRGDEKTLNVLLQTFSSRANILQLRQFDKHLRFISIYKLRANDVRPSVSLRQHISSIRPTLGNLQRELELGLELTCEIFGPRHCFFYDALHEIAQYYFKADLFHQWLCQLVHNFQTFRSPDLNGKKRCGEINRMIHDVRCSISYPIIMNFKLNSLRFNAADELLAAVIKEAGNCSETGEVVKFGDFILLLIRLSLLVHHENQRRESFRLLVCKAVKLRTRTKTGFNFLTDTTKQFVLTICDKYVLDIAALLLECGADVNEKDEHGNNTLHILFLSRYYDVATAKELARTFVKHGVHLDAGNRSGVMTSTCLQKYGIEVEPSISLKCLAARTIRRFKIPFEGIIPNSLVEFVEMH